MRCQVTLFDMLEAADLLASRNLTAVGRLGVLRLVHQIVPDVDMVARELELPILATLRWAFSLLHQALSNALLQRILK